MGWSPFFYWKSGIHSRFSPFTVIHRRSQITGQFGLQPNGDGRKQLLNQ
jgi:hypothetical protein